MSDERDWIDDLYAEGGDEGPPPALDAAILAAAREAASRPWYRNLRYLTTLATAASFVLAAMIVYYAPQDAEFGAAPGDESAPARREAADREAPDQAAERLAVPARAPAAAVDVPASAPVPAKVESSAGATLEEKVLSAPAETAVTGTSKATGRGLPAADSLMRQQRTLDAASRTSNLAAEEMDIDGVLATLTARCGPPPGTDATRRLDADALGWYLTVTTGEVVAYYRCGEASWETFDGPVAEPSEQQPDPEDDQ